jgi:hypothetical protein
MKQILATLVLVSLLNVWLSEACVPAQDAAEPGPEVAVQEVDDLMRENFERYNRESFEAFAACSQRLLPNPTWDWYWTRKAYLDPALPYLPCFGMDDALSSMVTPIVAPVAEVVILMWNGVMAVDAVRAGLLVVCVGLLVVCVGLLLGVGAKLVKAA